MSEVVHGFTSICGPVKLGGDVVESTRRLSTPSTRSRTQYLSGTRPSKVKLGVAVGAVKTAREGLEGAEQQRYALTRKQQGHAGRGQRDTGIATQVNHPWQAASLDLRRDQSAARALVVRGLVSPGFRNCSATV